MRVVQDVQRTDRRGQPCAGPTLENDVEGDPHGLPRAESTPVLVHRPLISHNVSGRCAVQRQKKTCDADTNTDTDTD